MPAYRWQRAPTGSATFADITDAGAYSGSSTATLNVAGTTTAMSGDQFRLTATTATGSVNSSAVVLTVTAATVPPANPPPSGGGGGGGAIDGAVLAALLALTTGRLAMNRRARRAVSGTR